MDLNSITVVITRQSGIKTVLVDLVGCATLVFFISVLYGKGEGGRGGAHGEGGGGGNRKTLFPLSVSSDEAVRLFFPTQDIIHRTELERNQFPSHIDSFRHNFI